ncbi:hypothetical protein C1646_764927 [Rhizophagus diaphanus]|nr:hypothetical protein C1646_764927 [Rhizophagus diaphanus] [Rhizophagus sp. MUCL 43196]
MSIYTKNKKDKNNNKPKDFSNKHSTQSPSLENISSQGPFTSTITSQLSANFSVKRTKIFIFKTIININIIISSSTPQDTTSTSSSPSIDTNMFSSTPVSKISVDDSQHFPFNSADKDKSVKISLSEYKHTASPDILHTTIQFFLFRYYAVVTLNIIKDFWTHYKINCKALRCN